MNGLADRLAGQRDRQPAPAATSARTLATLRETLPSLYHLIEEGKQRRASDLQLVFGLRSAMRIEGELEPALGGAVIPAADADKALSLLFGTAAGRLPLESLRRRCFDSSGHDAEVGRLRFHAYRERSGVALDVRYLRDDIPTLAEMKAPAAILDVCKRPHGLLVVTGPTGSGKTSLMAAITRYLYESYRIRIVTFEDPVEYVHPQLADGFISQCELGEAFETWEDALRGVMRAAPNVIIVGEVRDKATAEACLALAETGHLVVCTLHVGETTNIPRRLLSFFPGHEQNAARQQLAETFVGGIGMRLVPLLKGGRRPVYEILLRNEAVVAGIEDVTGQSNMRAILRSNRESGMRSMEHHLSFLLSKGAISKEAAQRATSRLDEVKTSVDYVLEAV